MHEDDEAPGRRQCGGQNLLLPEVEALNQRVAEMLDEYEGFKRVRFEQFLARLGIKFYPEEWHMVVLRDAASKGSDSEKTLIFHCGECLQAFERKFSVDDDLVVSFAWREIEPPNVRWDGHTLQW